MRPEGISNTWQCAVARSGQPARPGPECSSSPELVRPAWPTAASSLSPALRAAHSAMLGRWPVVAHSPSAHPSRKAYDWTDSRRRGWQPELELPSSSMPHLVGRKGWAKRGGGFWWPVVGQGHLCFTLRWHLGQATQVLSHLLAQPAVLLQRPFGYVAQGMLLTPLMGSVWPACLQRGNERVFAVRQGGQRSIGQRLVGFQPGYQLICRGVIRLQRRDRCPTQYFVQHIQQRTMAFRLQSVQSPDQAPMFLDGSLQLLLDSFVHPAQQRQKLAIQLAHVPLIHQHPALVHPLAKTVKMC